MTWRWLARAAIAGQVASIAMGGAIAFCQQPPGPVPSARAPMRLGAASNFSQGWSEAIYEAALQLPVLHLRDSIRWAEVETSKGRYDFSKPSSSYLSKFATSGARFTLTLNWGNPLYDGGTTPYSPEGVAAFARFAAEAVKRFPAVDTVEVGNEVNGGNFVSGPVKAAGLAERARYHLAMVQATAAAVHSVRSEVRIIGGSTHSLPAGYLWPLLATPGADALQGLAVHPYTTPIDQLRGQLGVLRRDERFGALPLHVTEIGSREPTRAADDLVRSYAMLASLGVVEMDWYPLNPRGDGMVPLISKDGSFTEAGKAFRFTRSLLAGHAAQDISPDSSTFIIAFGNRVRVMWGSPRAVFINSPEVAAYNATGTSISAPSFELSETRALVLVGKPPFLDTGSVRLGCKRLLADSFYQFSYPPDSNGSGAMKPSMRLGGRDVPFNTMAGQQRPGSLWNPYLGNEAFPAFRLTADTMQLPKSNRGSMVHQYVADRARTVRVVVELNPVTPGSDGIIATLAQEGHLLTSQTTHGHIRIDQRIAVRKGETITLTASTDGKPHHVAIRYRIRVMDVNTACDPSTARSGN